MQTILQTTFDTYQLLETIGEGGAGRVYAAKNSGGDQVAIKILTGTSTEKRKRFKNETHFLMRNKHIHIIKVIDSGYSSHKSLDGPFYVMPIYWGSLRKALNAGIPPEVAIRIISNILDGVEAAHLQGIIHRDLKPENILIDQSYTEVVISDFGVAHFSEEELRTSIETKPASRLANFAYAAPEQRVPRDPAGIAADIYALGLIFHELFTGIVPHGTAYEPISAKFPSYAFLDPIIAHMLRHSPSERPANIASIKENIRRYEATFFQRQKIDKIDRTVVSGDAIIDKFAYTPPTLVGAYYEDGVLRLSLDEAPSKDWIVSLKNLGNYTSVSGIPPAAFNFKDRDVYVHVPNHTIQDVINYFKQWLPKATSELSHDLKRKNAEEKHRQVARLAEEKKRLEENLRINNSIRI
ncbi:serine/threonine-protein kinase [Ancylobacter terrae]|uniref:serine/threonine-protein kinase n=1 Tax=Ancylobacter sp. sgz301288 TaxID=3342077 RepID=UPI00385EF59B